MTPLPPSEHLTDLKQPETRHSALKYAVKFALLWLYFAGALLFWHRLSPWPFAALAVVNWTGCWLWAANAYFSRGERKRRVLDLLRLADRPMRSFEVREIIGSQGVYSDLEQLRADGVIEAYWGEWRGRTTRYVVLQQAAQS